MDRGPEKTPFAVKDRPGGDTCCGIEEWDVCRLKDGRERPCCSLFFAVFEFIEPPRPQNHCNSRYKAKKWL